MPCGGPKKSPRTSSIVQIIFCFWSFEISEGILRNQKIIIGLDSFSNQRLTSLAPFDYYSLLIMIGISIVGQLTESVSPGF